MRRVRPLLGVALMAGIAVVLVACGGAGASSPTPQGSAAPTAIPPFDGQVIDVVAKGQAFAPAELEVSAGAPFRILLDNQDKDFYHNVAIAVGDTAAVARKADLIFKGEILPGPGLQAYDVAGLAAGTYWFFCQPHANMNGTIVAK